jgi:hypothetical protein
MVVFMSNEYVKDETCRSFFEYAKYVLNKSCIIVAVGADFEWQKTDLGFKIGQTEVMVHLEAT